MTNMTKTMTPSERIQMRNGILREIEQAALDKVEGLDPTDSYVVLMMLATDCARGKLLGTYMDPTPTLQSVRNEADGLVAYINTVIGATCETREEALQLVSCVLDYWIFLLKDLKK